MPALHGCACPRRETCRSSGRRTVCAPRVGWSTQCEPTVTVTSCRSFLERVVAHSQRFLLYPSPLGHQSCPPRAVQCPNTVWPLHFSLASAVCFYIFVYLLNFWLCWVFVVTWLFSSCGKQGLLSGCHAHCDGFSCGRALALGCGLQQF